MRITRATHRGRRGYNTLNNQGYGTSRESQIDNLYGREMEPDDFLALEEGRHNKTKRRITLAKVSILASNEDDNVRKKEMEKKKKGTASWHAEAIRRRAAGEGPSQIAKDFGVSPSRVSQVTATGDALERYKAQAAKSLARLAAKDKAKKEVKEKDKDPMADRTFEPFKPVNPADLRPGVKITCSSCGKTKVFRKHGTIHPVHAANVFRNEGWAVGAGPRADKCPDCVTGLGHAKPKPEPVKDLKELASAIIAKEKVEEVAPPAPVVEAPHPVTVAGNITAASPSEMTKADRRVINAKLEDVYLDETTGYKGEWTDEKVAVDLGVSVLWVSELREQNFGPAKNVAVLARQMEELLTFGAKIAATAKGIQSVVDEIDARIKDYDTQVEKFDADLSRFNELYAELKK